MLLFLDQFVHDHSLHFSHVAGSLLFDDLLLFLDHAFNNFHLHVVQEFVGLLLKHLLLLFYLNKVAGFDLLGVVR